MANQITPHLLRIWKALRYCSFLIIILIIGDQNLLHARYFSFVTSTVCPPCKHMVTPILQVSKPVLTGLPAQSCVSGHCREVLIRIKEALPTDTASHQGWAPRLGRTLSHQGKAEIFSVNYA